MKRQPMIEEVLEALAEWVDIEAELDGYFEGELEGSNEN